MESQDEINKQLESIKQDNDKSLELLNKLINIVKYNQFIKKNNITNELLYKIIKNNRFDDIDLEFIYKHINPVNYDELNKYLQNIINNTVAIGGHSNKNNTVAIGEHADIGKSLIISNNKQKEIKELSVSETYQHFRLTDLTYDNINDSYYLINDKYKCKIITLEELCKITDSSYPYYYYSDDLLLLSKYDNGINICRSDGISKIYKILVENTKILMKDTHKFKLSSLTRINDNKFNLYDKHHSVIIDNVEDLIKYTYQYLYPSISVSSFKSHKYILNINFNSYTYNNTILEIYEQLDAYFKYTTK